MREGITHSGRVRVQHHSWDSGKHRYPQHDALLPAHNWEQTRDTQLDQVHAFSNTLENNLGFIQREKSHVAHLHFVLRKTVKK